MNREEMTEKLNTVISNLKRDRTPKKRKQKKIEKKLLYLLWQEKNGNSGIK